VNLGPGSAPKDVFVLLVTYLARVTMSHVRAVSAPVC